MSSYRNRNSLSRITILGAALIASIGLFWRTISSSTPFVASPKQTHKESRPVAKNTFAYPAHNPPAQKYIAEPQQELTGMAAFIQSVADTGCEFTPWPDGFLQNSVQDDFSKLDIYLDPTYLARGYLVVQRTQRVARGGRFSVFGLQRTNQLVPFEFYDPNHPEALLNLEAANFEPVDIQGDISGEFTAMQNGRFSTMVQYYNAYYDNEWSAQGAPSVRITNFSTGEVSEEFRVSGDSATLTPGTSRRLYQLSEIRSR
ncbi:MAG: hypothetical protein EYC62_02890 [Alphaproteobacteria bacterium]|nr:MAG: hypothetical protein EYC62_02890 [Alphaproteobacteria bacterium]